MAKKAAEEAAKAEKVAKKAEEERMRAERKEEIEREKVAKKEAKEKAKAEAEREREEEDKKKIQVRFPPPPNFATLLHRARRLTPHLPILEQATSKQANMFTSFFKKVDTPPAIKKRAALTTIQSSFSRLLRQ